MAGTTKSDVFKFMHLRAAQSFDDKEIYRRYIKDEILVPTTQAEENACIVHHSKRQERNFMDKENIANNNIHYISSHVFEQILSASVLSEGYKNHKDDTKNLIDTIIKGKDYEIRGLHFLDLNNTDEKTKYWDFNLLNTTNIIDSGKCYIVPERIDLIGGFDDRDKVLAVQKIIEKHLNVFNQL